MSFTMDWDKTELIRNWTGVFLELPLIFYPTAFVSIMQDLSDCSFWTSATNLQFHLAETFIQSDVLKS